MKSTCVKGFHNLFSIDQSYETRVKASVVESCMDDDIETSQSSQESDFDVDIGMKGSMYTSATLKEMYTVGLTLRNNLYISLVQELATTCIRYYWNNVDVLIVAYS